MRHCFSSCSGTVLHDSELQAWEIIGKHGFPLFFNHYVDTQVNTHKLILCVSSSSGHSPTYTQMQNLYTVFTITYHYVGREVKIMLPIKVM